MMPIVPSMSMLMTDLPESPPAGLRLRPGTLIGVVPDDALALHRLRLAAAVPRMGSTTVFARESAAVIHGLPLFGADLDRVHYLHTSGANGQSRRRVRAIKTPKVPPSTTVVDGMPVTTLARTAADLMRNTYFKPALALADAALRLGVHRAELLAEVKGGRGCRHSTEAAMRADARSESPYESLVRGLILQEGVPMPELQVSLFDEDGFVGRPDFYWRWGRLVGEFDGNTKYTSLLRPGETKEDVLARQRIREGRFRDMGLRVLRWTADDVHTPLGVTASIRAELGDILVDHGMCPEAHDYRRPRRRR